MQTRKDTIAALLFGLFALACGDEREAWSGFPLFPADAGPAALSPELESSLRAAQIAFATQLAAEQAAKNAGAPAAPSPSADAGSKMPPRMAAESDGRPGDGAKSDDSRKRDGAHDAEAAMAGHAAVAAHREQPSAPMQAGGGGEPGTSQPALPDAGMMMPDVAGAGAGGMMPGVAGAGGTLADVAGAGAGGMMPDVAGAGGTMPDVAGAGGTMPDVAGAGGMMPDVAGAGGMMPDVAGAGGMMPAGAGGSAGAPDDPTLPSESDASVPRDAADGGV